MRFLCLLLALAATAATAQTPADPPDREEVSPVLIGGIEALQQRIVYPDRERRDGVQGRVVVLFTVSPEGVPVDVRVGRSVSPGLDMAAVAAVYAARFVPGTQGGQPVAVRHSLPVTFRINGAPFPYSAQSWFDVNSRWDSSFAARADSGAVVSGTGRLLWTALPRPFTRVVAVVVDSVITEAIWTVRASAEGDSARTAALGGTAVRPRADGFLHASDLVAVGEDVRVDRRVDFDAHQIRYRRPFCEASDAACDTPFPLLVGGVVGVTARARAALPEQGRALSGRVVLAVDIDGAGRVFEVRVVSSTIGGRTGRAAGRVLLEAVGEAQFIVDPLLGGPETRPLTLTVDL